MCGRTKYQTWDLWLCEYSSQVGTSDILILLDVDKQKNIINYTFVLFLQISPPDPIPMPTQPDLKSNPLINSQTANALAQGILKEIKLNKGNRNG